MTKLTCEASGDNPLNFSWLKNGQKIPIDSNGRIQVIPNFFKSTLTILSTTRRDKGNYACKVFNEFGKDEKTMVLKIRGKCRKITFYCFHLQTDPRAQHNSKPVYHFV